MNRNQYLGMVIGLGLMACAMVLGADTVRVRATALTPRLWNQLEKGEAGTVVVEFREGDRLPLNLELRGDFVESVETSPSYVTIKKSFWVQMEPNHLRLSVDGKNFKPIHQLVSGNLSINAGTGDGNGVATAINVMLDARAK